MATWHSAGMLAPQSDCSMHVVSPQYQGCQVTEATVYMGPIIIDIAKYRRIKRRDHQRTAVTAIVLLII